MVTVDTLRADHLGCYGYFRDTSPCIDALAGEGVLFERAFAPMSTTLPSHISLMTSLQPLEHGVLGNYLHLKTSLQTSDELHTASQMFSRMGYQTAAFVSCTPLKTHSGIAVGFETFDEPDRLLRTAQATTDRALTWLESADPGPLFLWVHYFDPHQPYAPPAPYRDVFTGHKGLRRFLKDRGVKVTDNVVENNNHYDGSIRFLDDQLNRLLAHLRESGRYDASTIVFTSDHGEGLGQHGWMDHGPIFEEDLHVPLILKLPAGAQGGARLGRLATLVDVLPTLVETLDLPLLDRERKQLRGSNLLGNSPQREFVFAQRVDRDRRWGQGKKYSLRGDRWKYYHLTDGPGELYDLERDPFEAENLAAAHPDRAAQMKIKILERIRDLSAASREAGDDSALPTQVLEDLKALGYSR